jgi:proteic killer suppression protein
MLLELCCVIINFRCKDTEKLFKNKFVKRFVNIEKAARMKLKIMHAASNVEELRVPPGNRLEQLIGDRKGNYSIRINDRWRICFRYGVEGFVDVEIVDYH